MIYDLLHECKTNTWVMSVWEDYNTPLFIEPLRGFTEEEAKDYLEQFKAYDEVHPNELY